MFSFSNFFSKKLKTNEIIDKLEEKPYLQDTLPIMFTRDYRTRHNNTYLLQALAWNRKNAALKLIELDKVKEALNLKDNWPTCSNSPLILAAKINAGNIIQSLVAAGANINEQDYRGFTALHYACILRNDKAIKILLHANANIQITDAFGKKPYDYYCMEIYEEDLRYRFGQTDGFLNFVPDTDNHYFATKKKCLSALRWYIAHIIVNNNLGKSEYINTISLYDYAQHCLKLREPIHNARIYRDMMKCFQTNRPKMDVELEKQLAYVSLDIDQTEENKYHLDPMDLVVSSSIYRINNEIWIELQEISEPPKTHKNLTANFS